VFRTVLVVVGSGTNNISTSFGADVSVDAATIEEAAKFARSRLGDEMADVKVSWRSAAVDRAAEIDPFMSAIGETVSATQIEQQ
jgi:hypothetical protein